MDEPRPAFTDVAALQAGANATSKFAIVEIVRKRVQQLAHGAPPLVDARGDDPLVSVAFEEIRAGKVRLR